MVLDIVPDQLIGEWCRSAYRLRQVGGAGKSAYQCFVTFAVSSNNSANTQVTMCSVVLENW